MKMNPQNGTMILSNCVAMLSFTLLALYYALSIMVIFVDKEYLEKVNVKKRFGLLYLNLDYRYRINRIYNLIFISRRITLSIYATFLIDYSGIQVMLLIGQNLMCMIFIGQNRPMNDRLLNRFEMLNEFLICQCTIILVSFTQFISNPVTKFTAGWISISMFATLLLLNSGYIIIKSCSRINLYRRKYYKLCCYKIKKHRI